MRRRSAPLTPEQRHQLDPILYERSVARALIQGTLAVAIATGIAAIINVVLNLRTVTAAFGTEEFNQQVAQVNTITRLAFPLVTAGALGLALWAIYRAVFAQLPLPSRTGVARGRHLGAPEQTRCRRGETSMTTSSDLAFTPATLLVERIRRRELSAVELTEAVLQRADRLDDSLHAFLTLDHAGALEAARQAEAAVMRGDARGALHGLPVSVKDLEQTAGLRTTSGSKFFEHFVPTQDGAVAERLRAAGGILFGKTNTPHMGHKDMSDNLLMPATRNPWDLERTSGGSSGGAAAAVASRHRPGGAWLGRRGLDPHSGRAVWRVRLQAVVWSRAVLAERRLLGGAVAQWATEPNGSRRRAAAQRAGRTRSAGPADVGQPGRRLRRGM